MPPQLEPVEKGRPIVLDKAIILVGRHPDCDVVLTRSRKVSRRHCCLVQIDEQILIRDLGSMNGVRVNGQRVECEAQIHLGDEVAIGDVRYTLQSESSSANARKTSKRRRTKSPSKKLPSVEPDPAANLSREVPVEIPENAEDFLMTLASKTPDEDIPLARIEEEEFDDQDVIIDLDEEDDNEIFELKDSP